MDTPDIRPLREYLEGHRVLHLASRGEEGCHATPLFYAPVGDDLDLVWISTPDTLHSRHLAENPEAGASISDSSPPVAILHGAQLRGRVSCPEARQDELKAIYLARFPMARALVLASPEHRFYLYEPTWARLIRFEAGIKRNLEWDLDA